jgi:hypothetical protein
MLARSEKSVPVVFMGERGWSIYGQSGRYQWATGGKWERAEDGSNTRKPLPPVATSCRKERM